MKKISLIIMSLAILLLTGCGKNSESDVLSKLSKKIDNSKGYLMTASLEIVNNDDIYNYNVEAAYKEGDYYRVSLVNTANNHEQIILKNDEGIYVLTPSLNKSFKFQSEWPYNNSQIYLLQSIVNDLKNDKDLTFEQEKDTYTFTSSVNYPNNRNLVKQQVTFSDDLVLKEAIVLTDTDVPKMTLRVKDIDFSPNFKKEYFDLEEIMSTTENSESEAEQPDVNTEESTETTASIEDVIYPLVLPEGTKLKSEEKVAKTDGERVILTFEGEKPFLLVEETVSIADDLTVIPTMGEPYMFMDTIGALSTNSLTWTSGNMEYYLVSDVMNQDELVEIASSISVVPTISIK